jgi:hypothetical protein
MTLISWRERERERESLPVGRAALFAGLDEEHGWKTNGLKQTFPASFALSLDPHPSYL